MVTFFDASWVDVKITKFQLSPSRSLSTVVKNIFGGPSCSPPPMSNRFKVAFHAEILPRDFLGIPGNYYL